jgi:hypothetical protein
MTTDTRAMPESLSHNLCGTEDLDETALTFDQRVGRCYELAGYAVVMGSMPSGILVHGSWHGPGAPRRIGHAWVEFEVDDRILVWEPITARFYLKDEFTRWTLCEAEVRYTRKKALRKIAKSEHWGRWHDSPHP